MAGIYALRRTKMRPARKKARAEIERAVGIGLRNGWRMLYPSLRGLKKQEPFDDWLDYFVQALEDAFYQSTILLANGEKSWYSALGYEVTFDPEYILSNHNIGSKITRITDQTRLSVDETIRDWWGTDEGLQALVEQLSPLFGDYRAYLIAQTESTALASTVSEEMMIAAGLFEWTWETAMDDIVCPFCGDVAGMVFNRNEPMPPDASHPGCRCGVAPVIV